MSEPARRLVVFLHGGNSIDSHSLDLMRTRMAHYDLDVVGVSVTDSAASSNIRQILTHDFGRLVCFMSSNYWSLNVRVGGKLLHEATGVPLVTFMQDHPIHFVPILSHELDGTITFALGDDGADFVKRYYPFRTEIIVNPSGPSIVLDGTDVEPSYDQFMTRENALLCPMNLTVEQGENIDDIWKTINDLPSSRREFVKNVIETTLTDCATPLHRIAAQVANDDSHEIILEDLFYILNFVKLWRRMRIVEMLIDFPLLFSSNYVPAMLERRYPRKFRLLSVPETRELYSRYRFVVNASPMVTGILHDRMTAGLHNNCVCVTDVNALTAQHFSANDIVPIDYASDSTPRLIAELLADPDRAYAMTRRARTIWTKSTFARDAYDRLIQAVDTKLRSCA